jgi:cell division septation protein DedD
LAAVVSEAEARKEWERLLRANSDLLGSLSPSIVRANLGAKGVVYRVQAGPLANAAAASELCGKLKARKVGCFVAH